MNVFNTQANIFKVNGGLADDFANRPAATGSFYLFYSIDTAEIFYDNGNWILISASGGTPVNIYNSNGTLTSSRYLDGNNFDIEFNNLVNFRFATNNGVTLRSSSNLLDILINSNQRFAVANNYFALTAANVSINSSNNELNLKVLDKGIYFDNNIIRAYQGNSPFSNINGFRLNYVNRIYQFGQLTNFNRTQFNIDDQNSIIGTNYNGSGIGFLLNFAAERYFFGNPTGTPNKTYFEINDTSRYATVVHNGTTNGLNLSFNAKEYIFGQITGGDRTQLYVNDNSSTIQGRYLNQANGLNFDFLQKHYRIGNFNSGTNTHIFIDDFGSEFATYYNGFRAGFYALFPGNFYMGTETGNLTRFVISDPNSTFTTSKGGVNNGFVLDLVNNIFEFGRINGGNTTNIKLNDAAAFPVQINGTNVTQNTHGSNSGVHLKVKVNGVDYVIDLKNP